MLIAINSRECWYHYKEDMQQRKKIEQCGLMDYVDVIVTSEFAGVPKPEPENYIKTCELLGVRSDECVFIGDDIEIDIIGACNAGLRGVLFGCYNPDQKDDIETIHSLMEIPALLID